MSANFDPSDDFRQVVDNTETVTILRHGALPGAAGTIVHHALPGAVQSNEATPRNSSETRRYFHSDGQCLSADVNWHLPAVELNEPPGIGDVIIDGDGRRWTILETKSIVSRARWKCLSRELSIAYGLDDSVVVLKAESAKGDAGAAELTWSVWRTGIRARIQPVEIKVDVEHAAQMEISSYRIFLEEDLPLDHTHRIRDAQGAIYQIISVTGAARLGELQTIEAVKETGQ